MEGSGQSAGAILALLGMGHRSSSALSVSSRYRELARKDRQYWEVESAP